MTTIDDGRPALPVMPESGVLLSGDSGTAGSHNLIPAPRGAEPGHAVLTAAATWALCAPRMGARGRVRIAKSGKKAAAGFAGRHELPLTVRLPAQTAALYVYEYGMTDMLHIDSDPGLAARRGASDPLAVVEEEIADFAALLAVCGGESFTDLSPISGGRHLYAKWAKKIPYGEMRRIAQALARRYISFDPGPMLGITDGLIVPPGAWVGGGRFRELADDPAYVDWVLDHPNGAAVWEALTDALAPELEDLEQATPSAPPAPLVRSGSCDHPQSSSAVAAGWAVVDEDGARTWRRPGGVIPALSPRMESVARTGSYPAGVGPGRYRSDSEARQAVVAGAFSCGWRLADVAERIRSGHWPGLAGFYARYSNRQRAQALKADWDKAAAWILERESGREIHTRERTHRGGWQVSVEGVPVAVKAPTSPHASSIREDALRQTRRWNSAFRSAERYRWPGPAGITKRRILRAMLKAAQLKGSMVVAFGVRELGLLAGLDHSTVAKGLRELRDERGPFIDLVAEHHGDHPDTYQLIIPVEYAEAAAWRRWQPGRLGGIHPVFRELGGPAALIYEQLTDTPIRSMDVPGLVGVSDTAAKTALAALAGEGLAERGPGGWVRGPADPYDVAERLDVYERVAAVVARYRTERADWRTFLGIVEANFAPEFDPEDRSIPAEERAALGPPPWMESEPHGPPALVTVS
ncbi:hypothetical protein [Nonomuraea sp. NPDC005650]|uniref:hypothetical protein n=1 Tax=Nonomuraea sp. NPDC005650 TaxID=3157045 RepID=UPI0033A9B8E5